MKIRRGIKYFYAAVLSMSISNLAAAASVCLQWPIAPADWETHGNQGGPCRISSGYKWREFPKGVWEFHNGVDMACKDGTPLRAMIDGVAYRDGSLQEGPHVIRLVSPALNRALGKKVKISYLHGQAWAVESGAAVKTGEIVAYSGHAGSRVTGPHLHLAIFESTTDAVVPGQNASTRIQVPCTFPVTMPDGSKVCNRLASIDPSSLACGGAAAWQGPMDSASDPGNNPPPQYSDTGGGAKSFGSTPPNEVPPPGPAGLDGTSGSEHLANDIANRSFNSEYIKQLSTLGQPALYRELSYLRALELRIGYLRSRSRERQEALRAALLALRTRQMSDQIGQQRKAAIGSK